MKKNVLVVGSGKRVKGGIIPALWCLREEFQIAAVYSRSIKELSLLDHQVNVATINSFNHVDFKNMHLAIIAVTTEEVPAVLKTLSLYDTKHIVLMLDTPVMLLRHIWAWRLLKNFKKALVSEDTIALPPFMLARKLIDEGRIGRLKRIYFFHNGFKYHAVASLKMLAGNSPVKAIIDRKFPDRLRQKKFRFHNGVGALLYEPRNYAKGKFLIEGESGFISDYEHAGTNVCRIGYLVENDIYRGLTLNGTKIAVNALDEKYLTGITDDLFNKSLMNTMKIRGLMDLIASADKERSPFHYPPIEGVRDRLIMRMADKLGYFNSAIFPC